MADIARIEENLISRYHVWVHWTAQSCPKTVIAALCQALPNIAEAEWPTRLAWGGLFVNGREHKADLELPFPCRIEYYEPRYDISDPHSFFPRFDPSWIVFQDDYLIACFKPARLPTIPAREQVHHNLRAYLEKYLARPVHMPSRIDMSTSGLVIASKHEKMHAKLQRLFERRAMRKTYLFECSTIPNWKNLKLTASIGKDPRHPVLRSVVTEHGKPAQTHFRLLGRTERGALLSAEPLTGRTHQIRVHAQYLGLPIVGDNFYGGARSASLHLLSYSLEFSHPLLQREIRIELPPALRPPWALHIPGAK